MPSGTKANSIVILEVYALHIFMQCPLELKQSKHFSYIMSICPYIIQSKLTTKNGAKCMPQTWCALYQNGLAYCQKWSMDFYICKMF
jgi:hypothetical protein